MIPCLAYMEETMGITLNINSSSADRKYGAKTIAKSIISICRVSSVHSGTHPSASEAGMPRVKMFRNDRSVKIVRKIDSAQESLIYTYSVQKDLWRQQL